MNDALKIASLVIIIMISQFVPMIDYNEMAYLPQGYWLFNKDWLANDWSLAYTTLHLYPFGYVSGFFVHFFGFITTIFVGRVLTYIFFSFAILKLAQALKANFLVTAASLMIFLSFFPSGMYAGEWIIGGLETKTFAYPFVILSIARILRNDIGYSLLYAGIGLSLHPLVGGYHVVCLTAIMVHKLVCHQVVFEELLKKSYLFLIGGFWGIFAIFSHLLEQHDAHLSNYAWNILVQVRVPFHNLPKLYSETLLIPFLFSCFNLATLFLSKKSEIRSLTFYVLSTVFISGVGVLIYLFGDQTLLRFYFFRFSDAMQPLLTIIILGIFFSERLQVLVTNFHWFTRFRKLAVGTIGLGAFLLFLTNSRANLQDLVSPNAYSSAEIWEKSSPDYEMMKWVNENTKENAVFIAPISMETFHMDAQRSLFVSWKLAPYEADRIVEWYGRILMINRGEGLFEENIDPRKDIQKNFRKLTEIEILEIRNNYPEVTHIIFPATENLNLKMVYETEKFTLYELPEL